LLLINLKLIQIKFHMAETMTVESLIDAYWHIKKFFTRPRFSYQPYTDKKYYSDVDVLAYKPSTFEMVFAESKAHGGKQAVKNAKLDAKFLTGLRSRKNPGRDDLTKFIKDVIRVVNKKEDIFPNDKQKVRKVIIHFVSTQYYNTSKGMLDKVQDYIKGKITRAMGDKTLTVELRIETHFDIIIKLIQEVKEDTQGKRYGIAILDIIRELNRHLNIQREISKKGKSKKKTSRSKESTNSAHFRKNRNAIKEVLGISS